MEFEKHTPKVMGCCGYGIGYCKWLTLEAVRNVNDSFFFFCSSVALPIFELYVNVYILFLSELRPFECMNNAIRKTMTISYMAVNGKRVRGEKRVYD